MSTDPARGGYMPARAKAWRAAHFEAVWDPRHPAPPWWAELDYGWQIDDGSVMSEREFATFLGWGRTPTAKLIAAVRADLALWFGGADGDANKKPARARPTSSQKANRPRTNAGNDVPAMQDPANAMPRSNHLARTSSSPEADSSEEREKHGREPPPENLWTSPEPPSTTLAPSPSTIPTATGASAGATIPSTTPTPTAPTIPAPASNAAAPTPEHPTPTATPRAGAVTGAWSSPPTTATGTETGNAGPKAVSAARTGSPLPPSPADRPLDTEPRRTVNGRAVPDDLFAFGLRPLDVAIIVEYCDHPADLLYRTQGEIGRWRGLGQPGAERIAVACRRAGWPLGCVARPEADVEAPPPARAAPARKPTQSERRSANLRACDAALDRLAEMESPHPPPTLILLEPSR